MQLKKFLDAEQSLTLNDTICQFCYDSRGCAACKKMDNPASNQQMQEDKLLKQALQVVPILGTSKRFWLLCEYPLQPGVDLAYL